MVKEKNDNSKVVKMSDKQTLKDLLTMRVQQD